MQTPASAAVTPYPVEDTPLQNVTPRVKSDRYLTLMVTVGVVVRLYLLYLALQSTENATRALTSTDEGTVIAPARDLGALLASLPMRFELSSPVSSSRRLTECLHGCRYWRNTNGTVISMSATNESGWHCSAVYQGGGVCRQAPLLVMALWTLEATLNQLYSFMVLPLIGKSSFDIPYIISQWTWPIVCVAVDVAMAHLLSQACRWHTLHRLVQRASSIVRAPQIERPGCRQVEDRTGLHGVIVPWEREDELRATPAILTGLYLFNPLTILTCMARTPSLIDNVFILLALVSALEGRAVTAAMCVAVAAYLGFYPIMILAPIILISCMRPNGSISFRRTFQLILVFLLSLALLLILSRLAVGSWSFVGMTYGAMLQLSDYFPNTGLFWYLFVEVFDSFRTFFLWVFQFHAFVYVMPLTIKFRREPIFLTCLLTGIMATFKSYPTVADMTLCLGVIPLFRFAFPRTQFPFNLSYSLDMKRSFLIVNLGVYATLLLPTFWHQWIYLGGGNANFVYSVTLVVSLALIFLLSDLVNAMLTDQLIRDARRGDVDSGAPINPKKVTLFLK